MRKEQPVGYHFRTPANDAVVLNQIATLPCWCHLSRWITSHMRFPHLVKIFRKKREFVIEDLNYEAVVFILTLNEKRWQLHFYSLYFLLYRRDQEIISSEILEKMWENCFYKFIIMISYWLVINLWYSYHNKCSINWW